MRSMKAKIFENLVRFITSGPVFAMVWEGDDIIALSRQVIGKTNVKDALPGTIRGFFRSYAAQSDSWIGFTGERATRNCQFL